MSLFICLRASILKDSVTRLIFTDIDFIMKLFLYFIFSE